MTPRLGITLGLVCALAICTGCDPMQGDWQDIEPARLTMHFAVATHEPQLDDLDTVVESFESEGPEAAPDHVRWLPLHVAEHWLQEANEAGLGLTLRDLPQYVATSRRLIVRPHEDHVYLLVHASPPKLPDGVVAPVKTLTVADATHGIDASGRPAVDITLDEESGEWVAAVSLPHVGMPLALVVDGEVYSTPILRSQIGRRLQISGGLPREEVRTLLHRLMGVEWVPIDLEDGGERPE